jgi:uncharacterized membrane protein YdjX (TVP38/TMEM64 family)
VRRATGHQLLGVVALGTVVLVGAVFWSPAAAVAALESLAARPATFVPALVLAYLARPFLAWPITVLSVTVGYLYGSSAAPVALLGAVVTCLPPYLLARRAGRTGLLGRAGERGARFFEVTGGVRGLAAMRLAPLPADPVSYGAGLSGVGPTAYVLGTALGELPWVTTGVVLGASLETLTVEGVSAGLPLVLAALAVAVLAVAGPVYRALTDETGTGLRR